jgi:hypothetical protein
MGRARGRSVRLRLLVGLVALAGLALAACNRPPTWPPTPPVASFDATPTTGTAPLPVTFTDTSTGQITSWQWDFGDGESANTEDSAHTYAGPGDQPTAAGTALRPVRPATRARRDSAARTAGPAAAALAERPPVWPAAGWGSMAGCASSR